MDTARDIVLITFGVIGTAVAIGLFIMGYRIYVMASEAYAWVSARTDWFDQKAATVQSSVHTARQVGEVVSLLPWASPLRLALKVGAAVAKVFRRRR